MELKDCFAVYRPKDNEWKYILDKLSEMGYKTDNFYALYESDTLFIYNCNNKITIDIIPFDEEKHSGYKHIKIHTSAEHFLQHAALLIGKEYNVKIPSRTFFKSNFKITLSSKIHSHIVKDNTIKIIISDNNNIFYEQSITIPTRSDRTTIFDVNVTKENEYTLNIEVEYYE